VLVIGGYVIASSALLFALFLLLLVNGFFSDRCISTDRCSLREELLSSALGLGWVATCVLWLWLGWRGRLFGCRAG
jgi:hypothetical protein